MSHTKKTVNERLAAALKIADENNRRLAVRMAKLEAAVTAICEAAGIDLQFENPEIEEAAKAMLGVEPARGFETVARMEKSMPTLTIDRSEPGLDVLTGPRLLQPRMAGKYPEWCEIAALDALAQGAAQVEP